MGGATQEKGEKVIGSLENKGQCRLLPGRKGKTDRSKFRESSLVPALQYEADSLKSQALWLIDKNKP